MPDLLPGADSGSVVATLRKLIIEGHYPAGTRLAEIPVATALGIKPKTVRSYRSRIIEKTNFRTTAEMIFYAVSHGLVERAARRDLGPRRPRAAKKR